MKTILHDADYVGLPWKAGGMDRNGVDCRGLTLLWLQEQMQFPSVEGTGVGSVSASYILGDAKWKGAPLERGDVVFFARLKTGEIEHCAVYLGDGRYLHTLKGCTSRIVNGHALLKRARLIPTGYISPNEAERLIKALADPKLGDWGTVILLVVSIILSVASYLLAPKRPRVGNPTGRYSDQARATQASTELPLPDLLGQVVQAGNVAYTELPDRTSPLSVDSAWNYVVALGSAPFEEIEFATMQIDGMSYGAEHFFDGTSVNGFSPNPDQTKAAAVTGTIGDEPDSTPSFTVYEGAHAISVPVDIRAHYDRSFPIYGFSGTSYLVFRLFDSTKFQRIQPNITIRIKGRNCRTFDDDGFIETAVVAESLTGADGTKVRFKLANDDLVSVTSVEVNATPYTEISAATQTGNVYSVNKLKGYIEFITAPAPAAVIEVDYTYHPRKWSQNPAMHMVYLLTEKRRGKGYDVSRIDWPRAVEMRDYCDEQLINGNTVEVRYQCNYAIDVRKPIQEHMRAILDSCFGYLFVSGGKFVLKARADGASVFSFTESHILADSFAAGLVDRSTRANRVKLAYHSEESANAETEAIVDDRQDQLDREPRIGNDGIVDENLKLPAVTSADQAARLAEMFLRDQIRSMHTCEFKTAIQGLALEPGDVVDVTHSADPIWSAKLARIEEIDYDQEDRLTLRCSEFVQSAFN